MVMIELPALCVCSVGRAADLLHENKISTSECWRILVAFGSAFLAIATPERQIAPHLEVSMCVGVYPQELAWAACA